MNRYTVTANNVHIVDSYQVRKRDMLPTIQAIHTAEPGSFVWRRSPKSLRREWATHNLLYALHIARSRTKDVDLNYPQPWYMKPIYGFVGALALIVIR